MRGFIKYTVMGDVLGDDATRADYERFASAVELALQEEFPGAEVVVELSDAVGSSAGSLVTYGAEGDDEELRELARQTIDRVWRSMEWVE